MIFKIKLFCLVSLYIALSSCSKGINDVATIPNTKLDVNGSAIIGGKIVSAKEKITASTVLIYVLSDSGVPETCTGSFISKTHILTAAHCVSDVNNMTITHGVNPLASKDMKLFNIKNIFKHKDYQKDKDSDRNDLAIISIEESDDVKILPLTLPITDFTNRINSSATLVSYGYGLSDEAADSSDYLLRKTDLVFLNSINSNEWMTQQSLKNGLCSGDSGGPVLLKNKNSTILVGIASGVYKNCHSTAIFMNIYPYLSWISQIIANE